MLSKGGKKLKMACGITNLFAIQRRQILSIEQKAYQSSKVVPINYTSINVIQLWELRNGTFISKYLS